MVLVHNGNGVLRGWLRLLWQILRLALNLGGNRGGIGEGKELAPDLEARSPNIPLPLGKACTWIRRVVTLILRISSEECWNTSG